MKKSTNKQTTPTSVRVTTTAHLIWDALASHMGLTKTGVLETLLREKAKAEGLPIAARVPQPQDKSAQTAQLPGVP